MIEILLATVPIGDGGRWYCNLVLRAALVRRLVVEVRLVLRIVPMTYQRCWSTHPRSHSG